MQPDLRRFVKAIVADDPAEFSLLLSTELAIAVFDNGATRQSATQYFIAEIGHYINSGDTALHFAAAAYRAPMVIELIQAGANVRAKNRRKTEPLHLAAMGGPTSPTWNPTAQIATIEALLKAGADPNAMNMDGTTPLHRAVRTRCSAAVKSLLEHGADRDIRTKNGLTAAQLAQHTTGRGGTGSPEAKAEQREILRLLSCK